MSSAGQPWCERRADKVSRWRGGGACAHTTGGAALAIAMVTDGHAAANIGVAGKACMSHVREDWTVTRRLHRDAMGCGTVRDSGFGESYRGTQRDPCPDCAPIMEANRADWARGAWRTDGWRGRITRRPVRRIPRPSAAPRDGQRGQVTRSVGSRPYAGVIEVKAGWGPIVSCLPDGERCVERIGGHSRAHERVSRLERQSVMFAEHRLRPSAGGGGPVPIAGRAAGGHDPRAEARRSHRGGRPSSHDTSRPPRRCRSPYRDERLPREIAAR
jgi:hypothetical protein